MATTEPLRKAQTPAHVVAINGGVRSERPDTLATEEPMEIRVAGPGEDAAQVAVTMRTPGGDYELAAGFLFTEGLIAPGDLVRVAYCDDVDAQDQRYNVVTVTLNRPFDPAGLRRNFYATSSCGVCGKSALDDIQVHCAAVGPGLAVTAAVLSSLPGTLRAKQKVFERTGGLHAAGLFSASGELVSLREDVGRHNAVDKVIGDQLLAGNLPAGDRILQVSGRVSFELVQKAAMAGIPILAAVGAPSSLAVEAGERLGLTVVGFVREERLNVYSHPARVLG
ncbi:MAG: formate dehydrogenase accessory sulfurtransferase FdhD [Actinomycetota bacterium]